ncbi:MAG: hypothetical protein QGI13_02610 [Rhodospirillales bacterium]|nr:hypothetical protein [Rhodospirillales bacterium]
MTQTSPLARGRAKTFVARLAAVALFSGVTLFAADVGATKHEAIFAALTDNAKRIIESANKAFGGGFESVCEAGRSKVNPKVRLITKELIAQKVLVGGAGFFQLEVENYYARICGRKFRRK